MDDIKKFKSKFGLSNKMIAEFFDMSESSFANSSARERYFMALIRFSEYTENREESISQKKSELSKNNNYYDKLSD